MSIEYINRRGKTYYLHEGKTKTGKPKYFFSMKEDSPLVDAIPQGYEIYENPNAQVFLRKIPAKVFTDDEIKTIETGIKQCSKLTDFILDVKKNNIVIYLPDRGIEDSPEPFLLFRPKTNITEYLRRYSNFSPMMRFVLTDKKSREFAVERWCFLGSIDDWISLSLSTNLKELVQKYCQHLGQESFYELM